MNEAGIKVLVDIFDQLESRKGYGNGGLPDIAFSFW
jgi:hypothetical protein